MFIASRGIEKAYILYRKRFTRILNPGGLLCLLGLIVQGFMGSYMNYLSFYCVYRCLLPA